MDRILIVEDDRLFGQMYADLLSSEGYQVDCVSGGAEALEMLAAMPYGLVVTDLVMPGMSGLELLASIRANDPGIDVILVTGNANLESAVFALKHGARDYLIKPVNPDEVLHSVAQCMQQRRLLDENQELKQMLNLFQACQAISGCLELDQVYHLMTDAVAREIGVRRAMGFFRGNDTLELKEYRGLTAAQAELYRAILLEEAAALSACGGLQASVRLPLPHTRIPDDGDIEQAGLVFVRGREGLLGVIAVFNDPGSPLPDMNIHGKNLAFLVDQSQRALENAENFTHTREMLFIDDLSGLFNHRYLEVALERELKRVERYASQMAILFMDIDSFKQINDTFGHLVGSRVLMEMGGLLKKSVREVDVIIRYGGDEYTIILVETTCATARVVAERIRSKVEGHIFLESEGYCIRLTCSIGYACCPEDSRGKQELLDMADRAMYAGKASGKNCITHFSAGDAGAADKDQ